jgi:hypothetical protein
LKRPSVLYFYKMTTTWNTMAGEDCDILLTKADGSTQVLRVGDCIKYEGRECVKITRIVGKTQPIGINYLPWRGYRWATPILHIFKGEMRRLICPGHMEYGYEEHADWEKVELVPNPDI